MDGVLCDYDTAWKDQYDPIDNPFPQSQRGFFANLGNVEDSLEAMKRLLWHGHDPYILTRPSIKNNHCWSEKAAWVEDNLGPEWLERLIITCRKDLLFDGKSYLIDDVLHSNAGQQVFDEAGKLILFNVNTMPWKRVLFILGCD